jgi:hypothetical protein
VVAWETRSVFDRALELSEDDPTARAWFDLAEPGWTIVIGEIAAKQPIPPPREGVLELVWRDRADAYEAEDGSAWSMVARTDGRALVDPSGWVEEEPAVVRITVHGDVDAQGARPGRPGEGKVRDAGGIAHAIDSAEERVGAT